MRRLIGLAIAIASAYAITWGVTWMAGDKSHVVFGSRDGGQAFTAYPGVLFGGLPPIPVGWMVDPQIFVILFGAVGLVVGVRVSRGMC